MAQAKEDNAHWRQRPCASAYARCLDHASPREVLAYDGSRGRACGCNSSSADGLKDKQREAQRHRNHHLPRHQ